MSRRKALLLLAAVACCTVGCGIGPDTCDRSSDTNPAIRYTEGTVEDGVYMSSSWQGELLDLPGGRRYEIVHGLGVVPRQIDLWVSFSQNPGESGTLAPSAGNLTEIRNVNESSFVVFNSTCSQVWLLVVASAGGGVVALADAGVDAAEGDATGDAGDGGD